MVTSAPSSAKSSRIPTKDHAGGRLLQKGSFDPALAGRSGGSGSFDQFGHVRVERIPPCGRVGHGATVIGGGVVTFPRRSPTPFARRSAGTLEANQRGIHPGQDPRSRQPPHGRAARPARRVPPALVEAAFGDHDPSCAATRSPSTARTPSGWASCSRSCACCSSRATTSTWPNVGRTIDMVRADERPSEVLTAEVLKAAKGRTVRPKTSGQKRYADAIAANVITFGIGPAGTGKSYLAVALAVQALQAKQVDRIILTRPAVEAGERLGFLPGDLMAKVDPYLRPALRRPVRHARNRGGPRCSNAGIVEVAPLAFMRGRTLNNSFIILDEAQNTTPEQMKMFLTRIGFGSKVGRHRRRHPGRPPRRPQRACSGWRRCWWDRRPGLRPPRPAGTSCATGSSQDIVDAYEAAVVAARRCTARHGAADGRRASSSPTSRSDHPVDTLRWLRLAEAVLAAEGVRGDAELSHAVRRRAGDGRPQRAVPRQGRADRRAGVPDRRGARRGRPVARTRVGPDPGYHPRAGRPADPAR